MNAYWPTDEVIILIALGWLACIMVVGYWITSVRTIFVAQSLAWGSLAFHTIGIERLVGAEPAGLRMLAIIGAVLLSMKVVVAVEARRSQSVHLKPIGWALFAGVWFGMRPSVFRDVPGPPRDGAWPLMWLGITRIVCGSVLIFGAMRVADVSTMDSHPRIRLLVATTLLLSGLSLVVHVGWFNVLAGILRRWGARCRPLFVAPLLSTSLTEFWGRRWNLAFSEMTSTAVFRPLRKKIGAEGAMLLAFLFSGLLHELAISVPVRAGFGLPLSYFALHAVAMRLEARWRCVGRSIDGVAWRGRLWTLAWLLIPLPVLFHGPFLSGCVWPLVGLR